MRQTPPCERLPLVNVLNLDGFPDVFDVGYLAGPEVYHRICGGKACSPSNFDGCRDRLFLSGGDGRLQELADATPLADSKGLGIATVYREPTGRPDLFIANDQVANHFLVNAAEGESGIRLTERALMSGLAFNEDGLSMACMGIAVDDVNADGRLDLFVTNFQDESNTLYLQDATGLFTDWTRLSGLAAPSLPYVGWGTQFLDADLDGFSDLIVANGHVDDYRDEGRMYQMRPQLYQGLGNSQFREIVPERPEGFLGTPISGRGLARLDWNVDGRAEFAISCVLEPARLCLNQSPAHGRFLVLRLHAVTTARDAIGTQVVVTAGRQRWTRFLLAGDGYMASNERLVTFGVGDLAAVDEVTVKWPSGRESLLTDVPTNSRLTLVEGRSVFSMEHNNQVRTIAAGTGVSR